MLILKIDEPENVMNSFDDKPIFKDSGLSRNWYSCAMKVLC